MLKYAYKLKELVYTAVGSASMCWYMTPQGKFDDKSANKVAEKLVKDIEELYAAEKN
jgi:hypothetical protein